MPSARRLTALVASLALTVGAVAIGAGAAKAADTPPAPPTGLRAVDVGTDSFSVAWDPVEGATTYHFSFIPLEPFAGYRRGETDQLTTMFTGLMFDVPYKVTVRAFVPSAYPNQYSDTATITVRTAVPEGYVLPSAPRDLRVERDASGRIERVRWDASAVGFGPLTYQLRLASADLPEVDGVWSTTSGLTVDAGDLPFDAGIFTPGQQVTVSVTASDIRRNASPAAELTLTCCAF
ncbi:fibronectin type III domain-containing protein [Jiangella asiatica]|uniref:Fibronectin type-III domain-containing protein n=1 Tax=Jiangella asiatica TaxID=2530372 RepID=A0A4R5DQQ5_9ACTN|nr:fibronectin type III domain-containing protein [Jiangella asiatica]TDE14381.1 hypothetical protein E1269_04295 [Jiangella asiatica]